jgi:hypothetical protein
VNSVSVKYRGPGHREDRREVAHDVRPADGPDRVGRFSDGLEQYPEQDRRIGRFSDGLEQHQPPELVVEDLPGSATREAA